MLLWRIAAGTSTIFVFRVGTLEVFVAAVVFEVLGRLLDLGEGAALALAKLCGAGRREGPVVLLQAVRSSVVLRRRRKLIFRLGLWMGWPALPVLYLRELPLPRALAADLGLLVARRTGAVVL